MLRRLLVLSLFGLVVAGGALATWHARGQALLVQEDLATARELLARAGGFQAGKPSERLSLIDQAERHAVAAEARLRRWPLRQLGLLPVLGRDVRVARAVTASATSTVRGTQGNVDLLNSQVFKVSHHASKHGVNLELVERISSKLTLVSSVGGGGEFNFPHTVTQELIREALDPTTDHPRPHPDDFELGIFYTADTDPQGPLGSIALVLSPAKCTMWRFGDAPGGSVDLTGARRWAGKLP